MKFAYALFVIYMLIAPAGQLLQKIGMNKIGALDSAGLLNKTNILKMISSPYILTGVFMMLLGAVMWLVIISNFKMSYIYPLSSIAYITMTFFSFWILGEAIAWNQWLGMLVIVAGCILINM
jgi:drug/metabolite transporter (DMT)-like permease